MCTIGMGFLFYMWVPRIELRLQVLYRLSLLADLISILTPPLHHLIFETGSHVAQTNLV